MPYAASSRTASAVKDTNVANMLLPKAQRDGHVGQRGHHHPGDQEPGLPGRHGGHLAAGAWQQAGHDLACHLGDHGSVSLLFLTKLANGRNHVIASSRLKGIDDSFDAENRSLTAAMTRAGRTPARHG